MRKKKTNGSKRSAAVIFRLLLTSLLTSTITVCVAAAGSGSEGTQKGKGRGAAQETYAVVGGTVFQSSGFLLRGAEVELVPQPAEARDSAKNKVKVKRMTGRTNDMGEFVFRVPAATMDYLVRARARGFVAQEKTVTISGEERQDVLFHLDPEPKGQE
jgi:hypothetical protein